MPSRLSAQPGGVVEDAEKRQGSDVDRHQDWHPAELQARRRAVGAQSAVNVCLRDECGHHLPIELKCS